MLIPLAAASFLVFPQSAQPRLGGTLDSQVKDFRYEDLDRELPSIPAGAEHDYLAGILANREGRLVESIRLLKKVLPQIRAENPAWAGGVKKIAAYVLPDAVLTVGGTQAVLHRVGVIPVPLGADNGSGLRKPGPRSDFGHSQLHSGFREPAIHAGKGR